MINLNSICRPRQWKTISANQLTDSGYIVYGANGKIGFYSEYTHEFPTVMITCRGATCGNVHISEPNAYINGNAMALDCVNPEVVNIKYLRYCLINRGFRDVISGSAQPQITGQGLSKIKIPLPPLDTQKKIAAVLEKADQLRKDCQLMEQELNSLAQSVFIEMFGDPVTNPKGWNTTYLPNHGTFKNGLNFAKADSGTKLRYLGVGDFKSLSSIDDMNSLGWIDLNEIPNNSYLLQCGDLVFVRSNGNKALVGRCISVYPKNESVTYSGFCIRYRVEDNLIEPEYLNYLLRTKSMKKALLEGGQGANIQNINQKILSLLAIPLPPKYKQTLFCKVIESYRESTLRVSEHSVELQSLFQSLMQKAFSGELNLDNTAVKTV